MPPTHGGNRVQRVNWSGRIDREEGPGPWRWHEVVRQWPAGAAEPKSSDGAAGPSGSGGAGTAFVGFACDAGVVRNQGRAGAAAGPAALRAALANLPLRRERILYDAGDVACEGDALEAAQSAYAEWIAQLLEAGHRPVGLGGGHEIAYGSYAGLAQHLERVTRSRRGVPSVGIVNFDAHFDLRGGARPTSGTPFRQIADLAQQRGWPFRYAVYGISEYANTAALFHRARALEVHHRLDEALTLLEREAARRELVEFVAGVEHVYLTFCLDVLPASVAPGVSAPSARGVALDVLEPLIEAVAASGKLRVADVAELNPAYDVDGRTARTAARIVGRIVETWAQSSR
jgi:formiminoglutamase